MASENTLQESPQDPELASENGSPPAQRRRGRAPVELAEPYAAVLDAYIATLAVAPLAAQTRRTYASKARQ